MGVRDTSISAYKDVEQTLGERQRIVYEAIKNAKRPVNNQEIANFLNRPINTITPRTNELVALNKIELAFKEVYPVTNRKVCYWRVK